MKPEAFLAHLGSVRASAILRTDIEEAAAPAMDAAVRAGFSIVEFTLSTPGALARIEEFAAREGIVAGAGTVLTVTEARDAVKAGARFLVSPVIDEAIVEEAGALGVAVMPGTHTPTEMLRAYRAGAPLQKLFPAPANGPAYVRQCLGPMPFLRIVPTSGADESNAAAFLAAGAFALGFVAPLFEADALEAGDFGRIEANGRRLLAALPR